MLGQFEDALTAYRETDAALRGDALFALGRLQPLLERNPGPPPWQTLWKAYRCHALCLAGRMEEAVALANRWFRWMFTNGCMSSSAFSRGQLTAHRCTQHSFSTAAQRRASLGPT